MFDVPLLINLFISLNELKNIHKDIFACLFSIHNIISLSCHEQVSLAHLNLLVHDMINLLYYKEHPLK